ncbi:MAG: stage 0 sporulation family protein [Oscillospiraceae bacterium]|nr:stage 0 sporulation family protein [Oscillospiraceae bacterium]
MTEVVSIKFKNRGKAYYFDPAGLDIQVGDSVIVDTANGMELAVCSRENHPVEDTAVVQPLRRVLRKATQMDLRAEELARQKEQNAMAVCREKIAEHGLDMKLVDVECNFEGTKTTFFFTSDGRVDFRALVKDLAAILHNRIELRQIGVRDEAKMLGGLGICGRPYCCNLFMDDFHPVSTKMAKVQSLSLNPAKISGSCGRLMCCLRYEQEAYEDLVKKVPKQGAFVETKDGYGTAVSVNLLRSTVKVRLDEERDDVLHEYKDYELTAVPGGRPKDGSVPPHVLEYVEPEALPEDEPEDEWVIPEEAEEPVEIPSVEEAPPTAAEGGQRSRRSRSRKKAAKAAGSPAPAAAEKSVKVSAGKERTAPEKPGAAGEAAKQADASVVPEKRRSRNRRKKVSAQRVQTVPQGKPADGGKPAGSPAQKPQKVQVQQSSAAHADGGQPKKQGRSRRRPFRGKPAKKPSQDS